MRPRKPPRRPRPGPPAPEPPIVASPELSTDLPTPTDSVANEIVESVSDLRETRLYRRRRENLLGRNPLVADLEEVLELWAALNARVTTHGVSEDRPDSTPLTFYGRELVDVVGRPWTVRDVRTISPDLYRGPLENGVAATCCPRSILVWRTADPATGPVNDGFCLALWSAGDVTFEAVEFCPVCGGHVSEIVG